MFVFPFAESSFLGHYAARGSSMTVALLLSDGNVFCAKQRNGSVFCGRTHLIVGRRVICAQLSPYGHKSAPPIRLHSLLSQAGHRPCTAAIWVYFSINGRGGQESFL